MKLANKQKISAVIIIIFGLLIVNYFYTFSNFVAYTSEERLAGSLIEKISNIDKDKRIEYAKAMSKSNQNVLSKYIYGFNINSRIKYKTIQQFYIEEFMIILLGIILVTYVYFYKNKN